MYFSTKVFWPFLLGITIYQILVLPLAAQDIIASITAANAPAGTPSAPHYVIDSDAANGGAGYDRDTIPASVEVSFSRNVGVSSATGEFRAHMQLVGPDGVAVDLENANEGTTTLVSMSGNVSLDDSEPVDSATYAFSPRPAVDLGAGTGYTLRYTIKRKTTAMIGGNPITIWLNAAGPEDSTTFTTIHFRDFPENASANSVRTYPTGAPTWLKTHLNTAATNIDAQSFQVEVPYFAARYDSGGSGDLIFYRLTATLTDDTGAVIPLQDGGVSPSGIFMQPLSAGAPNKPQTYSGNLVGNFRPVNQLDSANRTFRIKVRIDHLEIASPETYLDAGETPQTVTLQQLLHFNGNLRFGELDTVFTAYSGSPSAGAPGTNLVNTSINVTAGGIPGVPGYTFGNGTALTVQLLSNGDSVVTSGSQPVVKAGDEDVEAEFGGVLVSYPGTFLSAAGPQADSIIVHLPQGLSYTPDRAASEGRYLAQLEIPGSLSLNAQLRHSGTLTLTAPADAWVFDEARPLLYQVSDFVMEQDGRLRFNAMDSEWAHQAAYEQLDAQHDANQHQTPEMRVRLSNEGHFRFSQIAANSLIEFAPSADGSARTMVADLDIQDGSFITHFPAATAVSWSDPGLLRIRDGQITADSSLSGAASLTVAFDGSCRDGDCSPQGGAPDSVVIFPDSNQILFTPDGGLWAHGPLAAPKSLQWGIRSDGVFTHRTHEFATASFLAPGQQLYQAANPVFAGGPLQFRAAELAPGVLSHAGYDPADHANPAYAETPRYRQGVGIHPGATLVTSGSGNIGASRIADMISEYPYELLQDVSKYYVRPSGVSGRHVAVDGTYASNLSLYDYNFELTRYQLTFLSNDNEGSWVNGSVSVPAPSNFKLKFLGLKLSCTGELEAPELDPDDVGPKLLEYWNGEFTPIAINFAPQVGAPCGSDRVLTVGLISSVANIDSPLAGTLAFMPSGNIGTLEPKIVGVDARLGLPSVIHLDGPGNEKYPLVPVSKLYFNNHDTVGRPENGFVGFAATCDVPFFEDLRVHVMTSAKAGEPAPVYMAGGWTNANDNKTFFSNNKFDSSHQGFPTDIAVGTSVGTYQKPSTITDHVVRAKQSIFGLVALDYPLKWEPTARYFKSWPADPTELLVLTVVHQIDYLSAENTEISFGAQYDGLPKINLASAAFEIVEGELGAARALAEAANAVIGKTLTEGVDEIGALINDNMEAVLEQAIQSIEVDVLVPLYEELEDSYQDAEDASMTYGDWKNQATGVLDDFIGDSLNAGPDTLTGRLNQLSDATADATSLLNSVTEALDSGILAIDSVIGEIRTIQDAEGNLIPTLNPPVGSQSFRGILSKEGNPSERDIARKLVRELIGELAPPEIADLLSTTQLNAELNELLAKSDPALDRITVVLTEVRNTLASIKTELEEEGDILKSFEEIINNANSEINEMVEGVRESAYAFIDRIANSANITPDTVLGSAVNLFEDFSQGEFTAALRTELRDRLLASDFIKQIQYILRQKISELDISMRSAIDSAFGEVNRMCKQLIRAALGPIDDSINSLLGDVDKYIGAGSIDGYAHIQGDTLRRLRLDAMVQLKVPDDLKLQAYFEMLCYDSETSTGPEGCLAEGEQMVEVLIGATDVPLDWLSPDLRVDFDAWFSMRTQPTSRPRGIGAGIKMTSGELDFQSLSITHFAGRVCVGSDEAYLAATAGVEVSGYEAAGGIFFGRTCSITPLEMVDPKAAALLGAPPFTGAYVYGEVWIPISEVVLGIPASCFFRISAGVGAGAFYFVEGPTYGGRMLLGVSGEALCLVSIRGDVSMTGVMSGGNFRFSGNGNLTGKAGYCPFCVKFRESAKITYQNGSWDVDF